MKKQLKQGKKYGFNYEEEKRIYKYACDSCKKREIKKLSEDRKFNTYLGWKQSTLGYHPEIWKTWS